MGTAMRSSGYKNSQEIFNDIESGRVGSRTRDEIRTTRLGDKERTMFLDSIPQDEPVPSRAEVPGEEIVSTLKPRGVRPLTIPKPTPTPPATPTPPVAPTTPTTIYNKDKLTNDEYKAERNNILKGLQDAKVLDKDIFDKDGNVTKTIKGNYDSVKMMKWLVDNSPSQDYKIIAQKVHKSLLALKKQRRTFPLKLEVGKKVINSRALGQVSPRKPTDIFQTLNFSEFTMSINDSNRNILMDESKWRRGNGVNFETLLHEGIHQATLAQIYAVQENTTTRVADSGTMAIATDKKGLKVKAAYKELSTQAKRIQKYYRDRMKFYNKLSDRIETPEGLKEYNAIYNSAPVIEKEIADIYINTDSTGFKYKRTEGRGYGMEFGQLELLQQFNQYRIRYQLFSNEVQYNEDVSELLTFGLTNRDFQEMLEYIPLGKDATGSVWNKFVETIRKLLEIPAKLNTELSAFLKNSSTALDLKAEGIQAPFVPASEREVSQDIPTFSRESDEADAAYFARERKNQKISNIESGIDFKQAQLNSEPGMARSTYNRLEKEIANSRKKLAELKAGDLPSFSRGQRFNDGTNSQENIKLAKALEQVEETVKQTPRGSIPFYNLNASDQALEIALEFNKDLSAKTPKDIPTFSRPTLDGVDSGLVDFIKRTGGVYQPDTSWGARLIEIVKDPVTAVKNFFKDFRQNFIDKLDKVDKKLIQAREDNEDVRLANNTADTATMAALRLADRARGLFQGMLTRGYVSDSIEGVSALANVKDLELQNGETGGLIQILAPLFSNPELNLEKVFKAYATLKRAESFDNQGKLIETPVNAEDYAYIELIERQHPEVVEVYNNYQTWNNRLIDFAQNKGLLSEEQANLWREHSAYYPFYRNMVDDSGITAPTIAGGSLPNNPLGIKIEGSENVIDVDPIEAISRNSLSILTAALKNDGTSKLLRDLQSIGEARPVTPKQAGKLNTIFAFENGIKQFYEVDDVNLFHGIQGIGGVNSGTITKILAMPAGLLRDTVTRDPGFVVINILRDTLSTAVTSGAPFTPVVDSVKNMFRDMENLEKFGVLGGYDFSNDEGSVKQFITRTMRQQGLSPSNGMSASGAFFKLWDGLGALTTKSDGATRLAVYEGVYKKLKEEGKTEAQAQSEAAFQALEIINFGRRGLDPMFKVITAAIPFLNARVQGLDVLYRGFTGQYSSVEKLQEGETLQDVQSRIMRRALLNAGLLSSLTLLYYMMVSDTDEYKNLKREVRDDNWVFPIGDGHAVKIPIPFEVGMLFKAIPERIFDMTLGDEAFTRKSVDEALTTTSRQLQTSLNIPFFQPGGGLQLLKPISEVMNNRNTFTNTEIVPYYQQKKEAGLQSRATTNELARVMGEFLNVSPSKIEHVVRGYTGTLGGYVLTAVDTITRGATGSPLLPSNFQLNKMPVFNRLFLDLDKSGGYQQQFYELRNEVDKAVQTINSLKKQQRFDELSAYRSNMQGVLNVKGQVRAVDRYLANWRLRRDRLMMNENISLTVKSDMLRDLELERDKRLAMIPELREKANIPVINFNL